ncbi:MAG: cation transporter [Thermoguttaceae bacterium]|nr:cation transporter [Thermoguttaceae bacterium]
MTIETEPDVQANSAIIQRVTWIGFFSNILLAITKFLAGVFGHSQVLIADAVHSMSDLATDVAVLVGSRYWDQPADNEHPYGHAKLEMIVTLLIGATLAVVGFELISNAIMSLYDMIIGDHETVTVPNVWALSAAIFSILLKEWLFHITASAGKKAHSTAIVANAWHHRSDALSSIPAALAVGATLFLGKEYAFLDPIGTIVVGLMIFYTAFLIIRPTFNSLMDASGGVELTNRINNEVLSIKGVQGVHKIRTRPLGAALYGVDLHVQVDPDMNVRDAHYLSHQIQDKLRSKFAEIVDTTVHVEPGKEANV